MYLCFCAWQISLERTFSNFCIITDNRIVCLKLNIIPLCITIKQLYIFTYLYVCVCACIYMYAGHGNLTGDRKQHVEITFLFLPCWSKVSNSGGKQLSSLRHLIGSNIYFFIHFIYLTTTKLISHLGCYK